MIPRNSLEFQEVLIWSRNYKGICQVGTRVISENPLGFLERSTPRNRSNRYHLLPKWRSPKIENRDRFFGFHGFGESLVQNQFLEGWIFKNQEFSIFPNRSKRYACRSVTCGDDFPVPAWVPRGRCPYKNWNEMEVPEKLQKAEVESLPFRTRVPQIGSKFIVSTLFGVPDH